MGRAARRTSLLLLCTLARGLTLAAPAPEAAPAAPILLPAGVADASGHVGYFAGAGGRVEAIDLASGKLLWQTHEAQRPLLLDGDRLLAQAGTKRNRLRILRLDLKRQGECDLESDPVVLPAWVVTGEAPGKSFKARWHLEKHRVVLDWEAAAWHIGTIRPTKEQETAARKHASGAAVIDLRSGQVEVRPASKSEPAPTPTLPDHLERKSVRWQGFAGKHGKVLVLEETEKGQCLVLHSWEGKGDKALPPKVLLVGKRLLVRTSLDERILFLREAAPSPDEKGSLMASKSATNWSLFSTETGERIGRIPDEAGMHALAVVGKKVLYLLPGTLRGALDRPHMSTRTLKAVDLTSGKKLWERPVAGKLLAPSPL